MSEFIGETPRPHRADVEKRARRDRVFLNNPVIMQGLGLAPLIVAATTLKNGVMLSVAVLLLLTPTRVLAALLSLCMLLAVLPGAALAADQPQKQTIHIATAPDLLNLAESCRLDSWSKDKLVVLDADIDRKSVV